MERIRRFALMWSRCRPEGPGPAVYEGREFVERGDLVWEEGATLTAKELADRGWRFCGFPPPELDAWGNQLEYVAVGGSSRTVPLTFGIRSLGSDGVPDGSSYEEGSFPGGQHQSDIVYVYPDFWSYPDFGLVSSREPSVTGVPPSPIDPGPVESPPPPPDRGSPEAQAKTIKLIRDFANEWIEAWGQCLPGSPVEISYDDGYFSGYENIRLSSDGSLIWRAPSERSAQVSAYFRLCHLEPPELDAWGNPLEYVLFGSNKQLTFAIRSLGSDGKPDGVSYTQGSFPTNQDRSDIVYVYSDFWQFPEGGPLVAEAPKADFEWSPIGPLVGVPVRFRDQSTGSIDSHWWDLSGDGNVDSTARNPGHIFLYSGAHPVTLKVCSRVEEVCDTKTSEVEVPLGEWALYGADDLELSWPTVVITHGWQPTGEWEGKPPNWVRIMAQAIDTRMAGRVNVLKYAWSQGFSQTFGPVGWEQYTNAFDQKVVDRMGWKLAGLLRVLLGDTYIGNPKSHIQIIGHSLGTIVNLKAVIELNSLVPRMRIDQFTILDAPLIRPLPYNQCTFVNELPGEPAVTWVDNYYGAPLYLDPPCEVPDKLLPRIGKKIQNTAPDGGERYRTCHPGVHERYLFTIAPPYLQEGFFYSAVLAKNWASRPEPKSWKPSLCE